MTEQTKWNIANQYADEHTFVKTYSAFDVKCAVRQAFIDGMNYKEPTFPCSITINGDGSDSVGRNLTESEYQLIKGICDELDSPYEDLTIEK